MTTTARIAQLPGGFSATLNILTKGVEKGEINLSLSQQLMLTMLKQYSQSFTLDIVEHAGNPEQPKPSANTLAQIATHLQALLMETVDIGGLKVECYDGASTSMELKVSAPGYLNLCTITAKEKAGLEAYDAIDAGDRANLALGLTEKRPLSPVSLQTLAKHFGNMLVEAFPATEPQAA